MIKVAYAFSSFCAVNRIDRDKVRLIIRAEDETTRKLINHVIIADINNNHYLTGRTFTDRVSTIRDLRIADVRIDVL